MAEIRSLLAGRQGDLWVQPEILEKRCGTGLLGTNDDEVEYVLGGLHDDEEALSVSAPPLLALAGQEGVQPQRFRMIVHLVAALVVRSRGLAVEIYT